MQCEGLCLPDGWVPASSPCTKRPCFRKGQTDNVVGFLLSTKLSSLFRSGIPAHLIKFKTADEPKCVKKLREAKQEKEEEGARGKEIKQSDLTSEQWWPKTVDNIWVKIMNRVFMRLKSSGAEKLEMFSCKINIVLKGLFTSGGICLDIWSHFSFLHRCISTSVSMVSKVLLYKLEAPSLHKE